MEFSIKLQTIISGWFIVYISGLQVIRLFDLILYVQVNNL